MPSVFRSDGGRIGPPALSTKPNKLNAVIEWTDYKRCPLSSRNRTTPAKGRGISEHSGVSACFSGAASRYYARQKGDGKWLTTPTRRTQRSRRQTAPKNSAPRSNSRAARLARAEVRVPLRPPTKTRSRADPNPAQERP